MAKYIYALLLGFIAVGALLTSRQTVEQKTEDTKQNLKEAKEELKDAKREPDAAYPSFKKDAED